MKVLSLLPSRPSFYFTLWIVWFSVLWILSSMSSAVKDGPKIPHFDKLLHFGYFSCGAMLVVGFLLSKWKNLPLKISLWVSLLIGSLVGAMDEYHQSFTEGRDGLSFWDWIADSCGAIAGAAVMWFLFLKKKSITS